MLEKDSMPKPMTVQRFAMATERPSARAGLRGFGPLEQQGVVGSDADDQQQPDQMEDGELLAQRRSAAPS